MSRLSPDAPTAGVPASTLLHAVDGAWSAIRFAPTQSGLKIIETARLNDDQVAAWAQQSEGPVRVVLPASAIIARAVVLGVGDESMLDLQLQEQASSKLEGAAPLHRMATMLLPTDDRDAARFGVAIAWPEQRDVTLPPGIDPTTVLAVPDLAGLLSLMARDHTGQPIMACDPAHGSLALVLAGNGHLAVRSTHADRDFEQIILETALQAGWTADQAKQLSSQTAPHPSSGLIAPADISSRIKERCEGSMPTNHAAFDVAMACALATTDDCASLTVLRPQLPLHEPTAVERTVEVMSDRSVAAMLVVALIGMLLFGPLVFNGLRYGILSLSHTNLDEAVAAANQIEERNRLYAQLGRGSLPVTKLLADIASATPLGINLESVKLGTGEPVRISGAATAYDGQSAAALIGQMKAHLQQSRVFQDVTVEWKGQTNLGERSFSITATLGAVAVRPNYPVDQDFAAWTYQQRRYKLPNTAEGGPSPRASLSSSWDPNAVASATGSGSDSMTRPPSADIPKHEPVGSPSGPRAAPAQPISIPSNSPNGNARAANTPRRTTPLDAGDRPDRGGGGVTARDTGSRSIADAGARSGDLTSEDLGAIPEILDETQIATLNRQETLAKIKEVSTARQRVTDPELDKTLTAYWQALFAHLRTLPRDGEE